MGQTKRSIEEIFNLKLTVRALGAQPRRRIVTGLNLRTSTLTVNDRWLFVRLAREVDWPESLLACDEITIPPSVEKHVARNITFDVLVEAYFEQIVAHIDRIADILNNRVEEEFLRLASEQLHKVEKRAEFPSG